MSNEVMKRAYAGYTIELTPQMKFLVVELEKNYDAFEQATAAIDRVLAAEEKAARKKVYLECLQYGDGVDEPTRCTVTGIHAGHSKLTGKGLESRGWRSNTFYPDHPYVRSLIGRCIAARKAQYAADEELEEFAVKHETYVGGSHVQLLERFEVNYKEKAKQAEKKGSQ